MLQGLPTTKPFKIHSILACYNNAPVPKGCSFAGKIDKICPKTSKRLEARREVHIAVLCTLRAILLQLYYSAGGDTDELITNKRISTNA